jgi:acyl carrier protein
MDREELAGLLKEALIKNSRLHLETVRDDDVLTRDLGYDSFALLNLILDLEDRLHIEIDPSRLAHLREIRFKELVALVMEHTDPAVATGAPRQC